MEKLGPWFTLSDAAAVSDRSRVTLRRYLDSGRFPNARQDESDKNRSWLVPLQDLRANGVRIASDTGDTARDAAATLALRLAVAESLAEERAAEIERLERVIATFARQTDLLAAALERRS